ncbi:MAG: 4Fe-4S dicluster domain-containing protein [Planctomycetaceae bacterium]|nr:4Fe-4S dicluster domain-containing protein [Planctomycetaceae bacterium]
MTATSRTDSPLPVIGQSIPYERFLDCVHCGLCTSACPTYVETGDENNSPRGRIYLMRSVVDGRLPLTEKVQHHLDLCLDCRSCETACPSGVQYGRLIEPFRVETLQKEESQGTASTGDWFHRYILHGIFPDRKKTARALAPARWMQKLGVDRFARATGLTRLLPERLRTMQEQLPVLKTPLPELPTFLPAIGRKRADVALFLGCVADAMFRHVHWATARVLQHNGCDVFIPEQQTCCGAIHYHSGAAEPALERMTQNRASFKLSMIDAIIVNVAGCGAMLKDYDHIAQEMSGHAGEHPESSEFCSKVKDISEFLMELGPVHPAGEIDAVVAMQDACHLQHAQRIVKQPADLLRMIPGIRLRSIAEAELCCGAAGTYNLTQPEMADRLGRRKVEHLLEVQPDVIASANAGCSLQLQAKLRQAGKEVPVLHPIELLDLSYRSLPLSAAH